MNYELAKQLNDAGYPVKEFMYEGENHVINITLEELKVSIAEEFRPLQRTTKDMAYFTILTKLYPAHSLTDLLSSSITASTQNPSFFTVATTHLASVRIT